MEICNKRQIVDHCQYSGRRHFRNIWLNASEIIPSEARTAYLKISTVINAVGIVLIPILLLSLFNIFLLIQLNFSHDPHLDGSTSHRLQARQRRRVTTTVIAIGVAFSLTHAPSALLAIYELYVGYLYLGQTFYALMA
ncbi:hypothetical protein WR25_06261 [Diploscapter pachys]|uniref:G-protein coupled receptors family 1 profile domain-containing protein n=1 Tax=Diploscapter pachys TaxID=2018661 RepID=A0A2A2LX60_9BILA|nr:hypothetical protein WR25_06261 [Diploscapter pachys]